MSSISGVGGSGYNPLAALYQQLLGNLGSNTVTGQIDPGAAGGATAPSSSTSAPVSGSGVSTIDPNLFAILVALQEQQGATNGSTSSQPNQPSNQTATLTPREQQLFNAIDTNGDGQISKSELETAVTAAGGTTAQADALFTKLDSNGDGSVTTTEFAQALPKGGGHHHMHMGGGGGGEGSSGSLFGSSAAGDTTATVNNPDGSTTTTINYADGTSVAVTTPAAAATSASSNSTSSTSGTNGSSNSSSNGPNSPEAWIESLIKMEAQMIQGAGTQIL